MIIEILIYLTLGISTLFSVNLGLKIWDDYD